MHEILDDTIRSWKKQRPDLDLDAMGTTLRLNLLMNAALRSAEALFTPHGITVGEFDVLAALHRRGTGTTLTPTALARVAMISPAGMTNRLDRLEAAGLIVRRPDPDDRRGSLVELTAEGHATADRAVEDLVAAENELFREVNATERQRLDRTLEKLIDRLDRAANSDEPARRHPPRPRVEDEDMKLSVMLYYSGDVMAAADEALQLEGAGLDCVWVAEAYSFDAVSMMGYLAGRSERLEIGSAIMNIYSRTPTLLAMTAAGLDVVSGGRINLGLGASGPQVIEGFHGIPYEKPLNRTKEIIDVCRQVWRREVIDHHGATIDIPLPEGRGSGLAKPLKLINTPVREAIPIWIASLKSKSVETTAELADGWIPSFYIPELADRVWGDALRAGKAKRDPKLEPLMTIAGGPVMFTDDPDMPTRINDLGRGYGCTVRGRHGCPGQELLQRDHVCLRLGG